jgi:DNA repair photolyase
MAGAEKTESVAPVVLSASRATDIPAFYADWFMNRIRAGFFKWTNPFNAAQAQTVSISKTRAIVFWTKNPAGILPHLAELDRRGFRYYFHFTLNDYAAEGFEPRAPELEARIDLFRRLAERLGPERVVWRMDPLLLTDRLGVSELLDKAGRLAAKLAPCTRKMVFSFADIEAYPAVKRNLARASIAAREFAREEMAEFAKGLAEINRAYGLALATCAEAADLSAFGIAHNRCVDGELMARLWPEDAPLMEFLGSRGAGKDKGQRKACGCIAGKDIGRYRTCPRACAYCYANGSRTEAEKHFREHRPDGEIL